MNIIPTFRYKNAVAAIEWLCQAFGFEKQLVVPGEGSIIEHAQLKLGTSMIMLSSVKSSLFDQHIVHPRDVGNKNTNSVYIVVEDIDTHFENAKNNGAEIIGELEEQDYGGKLYFCKDLEGYLWNFGSYDPWKQ